VKHKYITRIVYQCGCGFKVEDFTFNSGLAEAQKHAENNGHTLTISGEIRTDNKMAA